jgi:hypothetical protein
MELIERMDRASLRSRADHGQRGMPGKIAHFSAELARPAGGKDPFPAQAIPPARNDAAFDNQPNGRVPVADVEKLLVGRKNTVPGRSLSEAQIVSGPESTSVRSGLFCLPAACAVSL